MRFILFAMVLVTGSLIVGGGLVGAAALGTIGAGALYYKYRKMGKLSKPAEAGKEEAGDLFFLFLTFYLRRSLWWFVGYYRP